MTSFNIFPKSKADVVAPIGSALKIIPIRKSLNPFVWAKGGKNGAIMDIAVEQMKYPSVSKMNTKIIFIKNYYYLVFEK
jgi:hypothetical protein